MLSPELSRKIRNISLLLLVLVAFIHSYNVNLLFNDGQQAEPSKEIRFLEGMISDGICRVAVPMFFAISGFLATLSLGKNPGPRDFAILLKKRVRSLLLPYLLVSAMGIGLVVTLQLIPWSRPYFNNYDPAQTPIREWLRVGLLSPVAYPLWFIRFLMDYFLFLPVLYAALRLFRIPALGLLFFLWANPEVHASVSGIWKAPFSLVTLAFSAIAGTPLSVFLTATKIELEGLFFFALGIYAAQSDLPLTFRPGRKVTLLLLALWLGWIAWRTWLTLQPEIDHYGIHYHLIGFTFSGLFLFWFAYDLIEPWLSRLKGFTEWASFSIGIYLFHEPFLTIVKKLTIRAMGSGDQGLLIAFLTAPAAALLFSAFFSRILNRYLPAAYGLLTGNRKPEKRPA